MVHAVWDVLLEVLVVEGRKTVELTIVVTTDCVVNEALLPLELLKRAELVVVPWMLNS